MSPGSMPPLAEALHLMTLALDILDREKAPSDIGAHLDLAIQRLREAIASISPARLSEGANTAAESSSPTILKAKTDQRLSSRLGSSFAAGAAVHDDIVK